MSDQPFQNDADQETRRRVELDSYLTRAASAADLAAGGRFKKENATEVRAVPVYPKIPSGPWSGDDPAPPEEPLGYSVNDLDK